MSYATAGDLENRMNRYYAQLYDVDGAPDDGLAAEDLAAASAELDGCLGTRYAVPVAAAAALPLLKSWTLTLAEELAWSRGGSTKTPENVAKRCEVVRKALTAIADGDRILPGATEDDSSNAAGAAYLDVADPEFTRTKMEGW